MKINLTNQLARLIEFTAAVAMAIRVNSTYNGLFDPKNTLHANDVMWLSDSLHNLDSLGSAILTENPKNIIEACEDLISSYELYTNDKQLSKSLPTFERHKEFFSLKDGVQIFLDIKAIAAAYPND